MENKLLRIKRLKLSKTLSEMSRGLKVDNSLRDKNKIRKMLLVKIKKINA